MERTHELIIASYEAEKPISVRLFEQPERFSPDAASEAALRKEIIKNLDEEDVQKTRENLAKFIEADPNNGRIILYLPFDILPEGPDSNFAKAYKNAWFRLLFESDARACFTDGDVLEKDMGEPERVRKAAHLIPFLLEKGIISTSEIVDILDITDDSELQKSLTEGLMVAYDKHLFDEESFRKVENMANGKHAIFEALNREQKPRVLSVGRISPARAKWEVSVRKDNLIEDIAQTVSKKILEGSMKPREVEKFQSAGIRAVFESVEKLATSDKEGASEIFENYKYFIEKSWDNGPEEKDEIERGLNHLVRIGIAGIEYAQKVGVEIPDLSVPFPVKISKFENSSLAVAAEKISGDELLSRYLFPVVLAYGSRVKGYASQTADVDAAVFFKPDVPDETREVVSSRLNQVILEIGGIDRMLEFNGIPDATNSVRQIHFLLGGVWVGRKTEIEKLSGGIAEKYLDLSGLGVQKDLTRMNSLRMLELDQLQFRLMHKGYKRLYPGQRTPGTKHSYLIDWDSDFWDEGYRKIATKLFLSRVFLPDLSE